MILRKMTKIHLKRKQIRMRMVLKLVHQEMLSMSREVRLIVMVNLSIKKTKSRLMVNFSIRILLR
jgi:hypothetical protein